MFDCFCNYQTALMAEFDRLSEEYKFEVIEASADAEQVLEHLKQEYTALWKAIPEENTFPRGVRRHCPFPHCLRTKRSLPRHRPLMQPSSNRCCGPSWRTRRTATAEQRSTRNNLHTLAIFACSFAQDFGDE